MGVAPDPRAGVQTSVLPGPHGREPGQQATRAGSSVYFRVKFPGAGFSAGDGHAIQGDGEFCVTALETSLEGGVRLTLLRADDSDPNERDDVFAGRDEANPARRLAHAHDGVSRGPGRGGGVGAFGYADVDGREDGIGRRGAHRGR